MRHILAAAFVVIATAAEAQTVGRSVCTWDHRRQVRVCDVVTIPPAPPPAPVEPYNPGVGSAADVTYSPEAEARKPRHRDGKPMPCPAPWRWTESNGCQLR